MGSEVPNWAMIDGDRLRKRQLYVDFLVHVKHWLDETVYTSSMTEIVENEHYQAIIAMGKEVLPFIFERMQVRANWYFAALMAITNENPVREEDRGNLGAMTAAWLAWAEQNGQLIDRDKLFTD